MRYNLKLPLDCERARARLSALIAKGANIELTEKKTRTLNQNAYLHLIIGWFAVEMGESLDYVKRYYFKYHCNRDLFVEEHDDRILGKKNITLKSSSSLSTEEMSLAIERFRNWAAEVGVYLPSADEREFLEQIETELSRNKFARWKQQKNVQRRTSSQVFLTAVSSIFRWMTSLLGHGCRESTK